MTIPEGLTAAEIEYRISDMIVGRHAARNRDILRRRLLDGVIYEKLAEEFELSVRQVKNIVYKGENRIFKQ